MFRPSILVVGILLAILFSVPGSARAAIAAGVTRSDLTWGRTITEHAGSFLAGAAAGGLLSWGGVALLSKVVTLGTLGSTALIAGGALVGGYLALRGLHYLYNRMARRAADQNLTNPAVRDGQQPTDGSETPPPPVEDDPGEFPVAGGLRLLEVRQASGPQR